NESCLVNRIPSLGLVEDYSRIGMFPSCAGYSTWTGLLDHQYLFAHSSGGVSGRAFLAALADLPSRPLAACCYRVCVYWPLGWKHPVRFRILPTPRTGSNSLRVCWDRISAALGDPALSHA